MNLHTVSSNVYRAQRQAYVHTHCWWTTWMRQVNSSQDDFHKKWKHCDRVMLWWNTLKYLSCHDLRREIFKCAHLKSLVIGSLSNASVGLGQDRPNYHSLLIRFLRWNTQFPSKYPVPWTLRLLQSKLSHGVESLLQNKVSAGPFTWKWLAHRSYFMARH